MRWWLLPCAFRVLFPLYLGLLAASASAQPSFQEQSFQQGIAAFEAGDYEYALADFLVAQRAGLDTRALHYNLGSTYYRLGRYEQARREFRTLLNNSRFAPTAHYNLGLIARRQDRTDEANRHFRTAQDTTTSERLRELAVAALTGHEPRPAAPPRGQGLISVAGGYDDNVTLASQADLVGVSEARDRFTELLAVGRYRLLGNAESGVRLDAALYARQYAEVNQFDQAALRLGLTRTGRGARWNTGLSGHVDRIQLDGEPFEDVVTLTATGARSVGARGELRLRYRVSRIEAVQDFEHLTGWRQRLRVEGRWDAAGYVKLGYELEWNDREDLRIGAEFFSQSPLRNRVYGEWRIPAEGEWQLSVGGEYRHSRYRDADVTASGIVTREDDKVELSLGAERALTRTVRLFGLYTYTDNDSELASFDYTRSEILGGIEWAF